MISAVTPKLINNYKVRVTVNYQFCSLILFNMLNFLISTVAFSLAAFILNRILKTNPNSPSSITFTVMAVATIVSLGAGWAVDKLDGDAERRKNDPSITEIIKGGDPVKIVKMIAGFN